MGRERERDKVTEREGDKGGGEREYIDGIMSNMKRYRG